MWDGLTDFVAMLLGKPRLYRSADPLAACNLAYIKDGDELGWHFDSSDFSVTLQIQAPEDGGQIGVVGFIARVGRLAVLLGGEGMDQADLEAGLSEGALDGSMVFAGAFDGDDEIAELVLDHGLAKAIDGGLEVAAAVGQGGGLDQDAAIEVGQEVTGACLGAVHGDDAEVLRPDGLNAWAEQAVGLVQNQGLVGFAGASGSRTRHGIFLSVARVKQSLKPKGRTGGGKKSLFQRTPIPRC